MMRIRFLDVVLSLVILLVEEVPEILSREGNDVGWIFLYDCFRVMLEDVRQLLRYHYLLCTVYPLLSHVRHFETYLL